MADTAANRIMQSILSCAIRLYPSEKRAWGEAILAESNSVIEPSAALSWTVGGLMVAFRAFFSRLFSRPAAKNEPALTGTAQIPPPLPWKLVVVCLAISGALLFVPDLRQGMSVIFSSWRDEFKTQDDTAMWEKIGREAESKGDAAAMAVAAMRLPDHEGARFDEAVRLAEQAVAKDPSLTWTYYFLAQRRSDSRFRGSPHPELTQRLQNWDPQNAVSYLAEADEIAQTYEHDPKWRGRGPKEEKIAHIRGRDPRWLALMDRAFAAPVYDTYFARRLDLDLQVMQRLGVIDPQLAATAYLSAEVLPSILNWREYANLRLAQGEEAERAGKWEDAAGDYWAVAQFGQRVCLGHKGQTEVELVIARDLQERSFQHLQPVLLKLGRGQEAQTVAYAAQLQHAENDETRARDRSEWQRLITFSLASGLLVHICAILSAASLLLIAVALFTFAVRRTASRFIRFGLTCGSLLLVLSCTGLLCAYHPYAAYYRFYLANPSAQDHESILSVFLVSGVPQYLHAGDIHIYFWWAVIAGGCAIGIWLVSRTVWKTLRRSHAH
ncbi:MAG: hypothetical protein ACLQBK_21070 [Candidatus Sulfotelmatobacter sp.]